MKLVDKCGFRVVGAPIHFLPEQLGDAITLESIIYGAASND
ncbi:hypothetical protein LEP1GSC195_1766 [Leptospira wolbachii serovar Codice str. CDC]|uniref:Uncharacterized protein n=1 Tax=Leptospira wolbachii serovar Codice str. CDC TaxID=1218599 RepID=R9A498_9LEPT|nr:hypothetical protein LEP1GSC195_1766 [Leptospira wolbachii serovar Codice str. CDC]